MREKKPEWIEGIHMLPNDAKAIVARIQCAVCVWAAGCPLQVAECLYIAGVHVSVYRASTHSGK